MLIWQHYLATTIPRLRHRAVLAPDELPNRGWSWEQRFFFKICILLIYFLFFAGSAEKRSVASPIKGRNFIARYKVAKLIEIIFANTTAPFLSEICHFLDGGTYLRSVLTLQNLLTKSFFSQKNDWAMAVQNFTNFYSRTLGKVRDIVTLSFV